MPLRILLAIALTTLATPALAAPEESWQALLERTVAETRARNALPAVAALVQIDGRIVAETAQGLRAAGYPEGVTLDDRWHIGSDTKAMTATMIARLVERGLLGFDETMGEAFPDWAATMAPELRKVTIAQLLSHTAGLLPVTEDKDLDAVLAIAGTGADLRAQRARVARAYLSRPPASAVGAFAYSNLGYVIAGAIAEARTGKSWEELVATEVFEPLGMMHSGFGNPALPHAHDQPWGHEEVPGGKLVALDPATPGSDNPGLIGPAGLVSLPLHDWLLFAQDQLDGVHGRGKLLKPATYARLHSAVVPPYSLGWGVKTGADGKPELLTHSGSNGHWLADIRIMPRRNAITLLVINAGNEAANKAIVEIGRPLRDRLHPFD
ncbi:serine hydrolase domain-containing protein [Novosphingobium huizhouense]|uniref:serine hydrolase domain-containing protein n=1 Tax=Novosphingobium huizhouense TaxID=2866625 RepID=UPI001CD86821|nr:serine hydrolase domain-containing protein [Novosphingobium huizhouense]